MKFLDKKDAKGRNFVELDPMEVFDIISCVSHLRNVLIKEFEKSGSVQGDGATAFIIVAGILDKFQLATGWPLPTMEECEVKEKEAKELIMKAKLRTSN